MAQRPSACKVFMVIALECLDAHDLSILPAFIGEVVPLRPMSVHHGTVSEIKEF
ncbi:hypothetical protein [Rhodoferax sp.]|uniref:hypothetical protein n=1 Tax=Rhodoferax sp. TaxID=50421 RepID=UPI002852B00C|nr:hypothetical protein [Rhodoferax sp.]